MYIGTAEFQTANAQPFQKHRVRGTIDAIPFTSANILAGSMTITNQISDAADAKIGSVYIGKLTVTFLNNLVVNPRTWRNRKIVVNFGLCTSESPDVYEYFKIGEFYVSEANITADGINITAYDAMSFFSVPLPDSYIASGTVYSIANNICQICGVSFGMTQVETEALPNGSVQLGLFTPNDCQTYRDIIYWLSVTVGGWATINRAGQLVFGTYDRENTAVETITPAMRVQGATFSDFVTDFGSARFENEDGTVEVIGTPNIGVSYNVGFDPFLQFGTFAIRYTLRRRVFEAINNMQFMPFKIERISAPVYDLGDIVEISGGIAATIENIGCIQSITWNLGKGLTIAGFGADPNLKNAQSANDSANAAATRATKASEMVYKKYQNLTAINVATEPVKVVNIDFIADRKTTVELWHEIQLETALSAGSSEMTVEAVYYMDYVEQARKPVETFTDSAFHLLDLHYEMEVEDAGSHIWEVYLEASGGTAAIRINDILALLKGQGISKVDAWNGIIILDDEMPRIPIIMQARGLTDEATLETHNNDTERISDTYTRVSPIMQVRALTESINITMYQPEFNIVTEDDEFNITDETGIYNIETE